MQTTSGKRYLFNYSRNSFRIQISMYHYDAIYLISSIKSYRSLKQLIHVKYTFVLRSISVHILCAHPSKEVIMLIQFVKRVYWTSVTSSRLFRKMLRFLEVLTLIMTACWFLPSSLGLHAFEEIQIFLTFLLKSTSINAQYAVAYRIL